MTLLYYTQTYYLDAVLELLQSLKCVANVHLLIEVTPESRKSTVVDLPCLDTLSTIELAEKVIGPEKWPLFSRYFDGISSIHFVVFHASKGFAIHNLHTCIQVAKMMNVLKPDIVHLDTVSIRSLGLIPFLLNKKLVITVHDPVFHSGEYSWKASFVRLLFFWKANKFLFYSSFAAKQFYLTYPTIRIPGNILKFQSFGYTKQLAAHVEPKGEYILFFGRLSVYKGIDLLIDAIPGVLKMFPYERFVVAGRAENYSLNSKIIDQYKDSIEVINSYLTSKEVANLIQRSKFIVCPYRDATQSGVLMTAFAFGKTVVATNVGAFPEYIKDGHNGLLASPTVDDIQTKILTALTGKRYLQLELNIHSGFSSTTDIYNQVTLKKTYSFL